MRHSPFRRRYHPGRRGTPRLLRCEPLEHRWLLSITVDTLVDEADGSIDDGDISLRDAIAAAATGETIDFAALLDGGTIQLQLGALEIRTSLSIDGPGPGDLTIDAQGNSRVFDVDDGAADNLLDVVISGLTITGGHSDSGGGIVSLENLKVSKVSISDSVISGNSTNAQVHVLEADGGGIFQDGDLTLLNSRVTGNTSQHRGGGIVAGGRTTIIGSTISDNAVRGDFAEGGGLVVGGNDMQIVDTTVSGNSVNTYDGHGGGIVCGGGEIINTTISGNDLHNGWIGSGGGIYKSGGNLTIQGSTISGNGIYVTEDAFGGGIHNTGGNLTLTGSTVYGNRADATSWAEVGGRGGGIFNDGDILQVNGSIVAGNSHTGYASDLSGAVNVTHSLVGENSGTDLDEAPLGMPDADGNLIGDLTGSGAIEPLLGSLANNGGPTETHALLPGSPAIDAGDPDFVPPPESDQRGVQRIADGDADGISRIDMGAYELLRGDLNGDGQVNGLDVDPFVDALTSGRVTSTADMNADGVDGLDVDPFVGAVVGGSNQGEDPPRVIHRRTVQHATARQARIGTDVREGGQRSPPGNLVHDVQHEAAGSWYVVVDLAMRDDTNWDRRR